MYQKKLDDDIRCPLEYGLQLFGGKWKSRVICVLNEAGKLRYSELRSEMTNITDAVLAATLKELQSDGLVSRKSYDVIPPKVEYSLTKRGESVIPILQSICKWAGIYHREESGIVMKQCQKCDYRASSQTQT
ncbi:MAG: winged helix-turn-helix transcriptional regulator [Anaerovoracaceae bacterium]|jgi:DNA-binding HxlR family transcriptional regulator